MTRNRCLPTYRCNVAQINKNVRFRLQLGQQFVKSFISYNEIHDIDLLVQCKSKYLNKSQPAWHSTRGASIVTNVRDILCDFYGFFLEICVFFRELLCFCGFFAAV